MKTKRFAISLVVAMLVLFGMLPHTAAAATGTPDISSIIAAFRQSIPPGMQNEGIPGLAIAVVDDQSVLWAEGFGYTDTDGKTPITPDTLFSIQSMSKSFTATAVMFAAEQGLVDLDVPITTYLPDFHVNSIYEEDPVSKMTLRILLSHTAGFVHEATIGSNFDLPAGHTFAEHVASISDTWLKFPVGTRYSYSNLDIDLAGYILEVVSGMPFTEYVRQVIFNPLGMGRSTFATAQIRQQPNRAIGHTPSPFRPLAEITILSSGGVYTTANDMARYLMFHINRGAAGGSQLLDPALAETMYTPPNEPSRTEGYALGITVGQRNGARRFQHGGGGFGFNSNMVWYPELKLGVALLSNKHHDVLIWDLADDILDAIIALDPDLYAGRAAQTPNTAPAYPPSYGGAVLTDPQLDELLGTIALPQDDAARNRATQYAGDYVIPNWGFPNGIYTLLNMNGKLALNSMFFTEVEPGFYFDKQGNMLDFRGPQPRDLNILIVKVRPAVRISLFILFGVTGLLGFGAIIVAPLASLIQRIRRKAKLAGKALGWARIFGALASLVALLVIAASIAANGLMYLPWPRGFVDLQWWAKLLLALPYTGLALAIAVGVFAALAWKEKSISRFTRLYYLILALVLVFFNIVVIF